MLPVFVGDVQGCAAELDELIARLERRLGRDGFELWLVGDLVNRGPDSLGVLRRVRDLMEAGRARCVLGNHEVWLLHAFVGLREPGPRDTFVDVLRAPDRDEWFEWVRHLPLLETGRIADTPFAMVHASVPPGWALQRIEAAARRAEARLRDPDVGALRRFLRARPEDDPDRDLLGRLVHCRSIDERGAWSSEEPAKRRDAWHRRWRREDPDFAVVYGHWATQGLHVAPHLRGLDTGCVHHGRGHDGNLTAWIPDPTADDPFGVPDPGRLVQVRAHRPWYLQILQREAADSP